MNDREPSSHDIDNGCNLGAGLPLTPVVDLGKLASKVLDRTEKVAEKIFSRSVVCLRAAKSALTDTVELVRVAGSNDESMRDASTEPTSKSPR